MLEPVLGTPTWRPETSGNIWSLLWLSQHFSQHIGYSELEDIRRIDIFVHVTCHPEKCRCHCEGTVFYFQNKAVYRAEDRPEDICLQMTLT